MSIPYDIELRGIGAEPGTIDAVMLRDILDALISVASRTLRLSVEGISSRPGPKPSWVDDSVRFIVRGIGEGSTVLPIDVLSLGDTTGSIIRQQDFWMGKPSPDDTALSLVGRTIQDIERKNRESQRYDRGVLKALAAFGRVITNGEVIHVKNRNNHRRIFSITREHIHHAEALERDIPAPRGVVLSAHLDMIEHSQRSFTLLTEDGKKIRGSTSAVAEERLRDLCGKEVTLQGQAHFTAAGSLRFIEAQVIRAFQEGDRLFKKTKKELAEELLKEDVNSKQRLRSGDVGQALQELRGTWPGDESIDEILNALD